MSGMKLLVEDLPGPMNLSVSTYHKPFEHLRVVPQVKYIRSPVEMVRLLNLRTRHRTLPWLLVRAKTGNESATTLQRHLAQ